MAFHIENATTFSIGSQFRVCMQQTQSPTVHQAKEQEQTKRIGSCKHSIGPATHVDNGATRRWIVMQKTHINEGSGNDQGNNNKGGSNSNQKEMIPRHFVITVASCAQGN